MKSKLLTAAAVFFLAKSALAGGSTVGNGGNTIVCTDANGQIKSVELLDFYEARIKRGVTPDLGDDTLSVDDKVALAMKRLDAVDKDVGYTLAQLNTFKKDSVFLPGIRLVTVDDSDHLFVPAGCQQEQTAIQKTPEFPGDKLFNIDQDLWNHMDSNNRAGLILHEIFYHMSLQYAKPDNSIGVRFFVSSISSAQSITLRELVEVFRSLKYTGIEIDGYYYAVGDYAPGFNRDGSFLGGNLENAAAVYQLGGKVIWIKSLMFRENHTLQNVTLAQDAYLKFGDQYLWFAADGTLALADDGSVLAGEALPQKVEFKAPGRFDLFLTDTATSPSLISLSNGMLQNCDHCTGSVSLLGQEFQVDSFNYSEEGTQVHLAAPATLKYLGRDILIRDRFDVTADGLLRGLELAEPTTFTVGTNQILFGENLVIFDKNGKITSGYLGEETTLTYIDGTQIPYLKGMALSFDKNGRVTRGNFPPAQ
jgi:hypothetical protein